jgi:hypothetical protein
MMDIVRYCVYGLIPVVLAAGCAKSDGLNRGGTITGTVTVDGKPIPGGTIQFYSADGVHAPQVNVKPDGTYLIHEPPLGPCRVVVRTSHLRHLAGRPAPKGSEFVLLDEDTAAGYVPIPAKYESREETDLIYDVPPGDSVFNVDLSIGKSSGR